MKIKDIEFPGRAFLAPMAGVADRAFREVCASFGAAYTVTEMVSAKGLSMGDKKSAALLTLGKEEGIAGAQIFGDDPAVMALAAVKCLEYKPDIIDINMGCPAPKVANNGGGASLMKNPRLAGEIVRAVSDAVDIPVTVKIRKGWDDNSVNAVEMAQIAEQNGAAAIAVHGRTRVQMYSGTVVDEASAAKMAELTDCDAIMIGRGAMGNPWLFRRINAYFDECRIIPEPSVEEKVRVMLAHIQKMIEYKGEHTAMREARRHAAYYTKGLRGGAKFRAEMGSLESFEQLCEITFRIVKENQ